MVLCQSISRSLSFWDQARNNKNIFWSPKYRRPQLILLAVQCGKLSCLVNTVHYTVNTAYWKPYTDYNADYTVHRVHMIQSTNTRLLQFQLYIVFLLLQFTKKKITLKKVGVKFTLLITQWHSHTSGTLFCRHSCTDSTLELLALSYWWHNSKTALF